VSLVFKMPDSIFSLCPLWPLLACKKADHSLERIHGEGTHEEERSPSEPSLPAIPANVLDNWLKPPWTSLAASWIPLSDSSVCSWNKNYLVEPCPKIQHAWIHKIQFIGGYCKPLNLGVVCFLAKDIQNREIGWSRLLWSWAKIQNWLFWSWTRIKNLVWDNQKP
jgi:hypothetical protein